MQIFVKLSGKSYVVTCKSGDLIDSVVIKAFKKFIEENGRCIYSTIQDNYYNYLRSSRFNFLGNNFRFGSNIIITQDMNEHTIQHCYIGGPSKKFTIEDINYINELLKTSRL